LAARAARALLSRDRRVLVVRPGGGGGDRWGPPPREVAAFAPPPPRPGPRRRRRRRCLGRGARRQAGNERGDMRCGGAGAHRGDVRGCGGNDVRQAPEEKEEGIFHPEVSDRFPSRAFLDWPWPKFLVCRVRRVAPTVPPLAPAKVLRTDAIVPTRRRSSRALRAATSTAPAASGGSQSAAEATEPQPVATATAPHPAAVEAQQSAAVVEP
jgi:hypothetical protein